MKNDYQHQQDIKDILKKSQLSSTKPRREILKFLMSSHGPFSVETILENLPSGTCDQATVYRSLSQFKEVGLVKEINLGEDFSRFEFNHPHHHHHIICRNCQDVEVIEDCDLSPILDSLKSKGYKQIDHSLEFFGVCPKCQD